MFDISSTRKMERQKTKNPKLKINLFFFSPAFFNKNGTFGDPSIVIEMILKWFLNGNNSKLLQSTNSTLNFKLGSVF